MIHNGRPFRLPQLKRHRYEPLGRCMYCDARDELTDEHILPFGLGGNLILPQSSCAACAAITSRFERTVLRGPLRAVRVFRGIQSRSKHRDAPTILPLQAKIDGEWRRVELPHDEYPIIAQFLRLAPPGYFNPEGYGGDIVVEGYFTYGWGPHPRDVAKRLGASDLQMPQSHTPGHFALLVAKVAYGMAVANGLIDLDAGRPAVVAAIRGDVRNIGMWVGLTDEARERTEDGSLHQVAVIVDRGAGLLLGRVQLLSDTGTPIYTVVLGALDEPFVRAAS